MGVRGKAFLKYVVRDSWNRADKIASTGGAALSVLLTHIVSIESGKMLSGTEPARTIEVALLSFCAIWALILLCRACWWPFHWRLVAHGGLHAFLRAKLGDFMWPVILVAGGLLAFVLLTGSGTIWLSLQYLSGTTQKSETDPNTVGNPDFTLSVPEGRYRFSWPAQHDMSFYIRLDTQRNPEIWNSPAFILRNRTNTVAYRISATWKSETAMDLKKEVESQTKLAFGKFIIGDTNVIIMRPKADVPLANYQYYLDDSPKQTIPVIAKEEEVYFPMQLWPLAAIYLTARMPDKIGETTPPFVARVTLDWETSEGKRQRAYRVKISATNAKASSSNPPVIDAYLNFSLEEIGH